MSTTEQIAILDFRIGSKHYCLINDFVVKCMEMPALENDLALPDYFLGKQVSKKSFPVFDLARLFSVTLQDYNQDVLGTAKEKHTQWVRALEKSVLDHSPFTLPTNAHKCAFGVWYDQYETDSFALRYVLKKIDEPHKLLHQQAMIIEMYKSQGNQEGVQEALEYARYLCYEVMIPLLDELVTTYHNTRNQHMIVIQSNEKTFGVAADSIGKLTRIRKEKMQKYFSETSYISHVVKLEQNQECFMLDLMNLSKLVRLSYSF